MLKRLLVLLLAGLIPTGAFCQAQKCTLSGYVKDAASGEVIIGAVVNPVGTSMGAVTNAYGYYALEVPKGTYMISCSSLGFAADTLKLDISANLRHDFLLPQESLMLEGARVTAVSKKDRLQRPEMGLAAVTGDLAKKIPVIFGETDIIKVIQMMPGVQSPSEGSTGFVVRGGAVDQNLILMDEAPVYNVGHFMGFFSVFNNDAVKTADLYKGDIAAKYGGRLSSLLDVHTKDGNMQQLRGSLSVGLISSKAMIEGPIVKDKASFMIAARRTYLDMFFPLAKSLKGDKLFFYDLNAKANWIVGENDRLYLSAFSGHDIFGMHNRDVTDIDMEVDFANNTQSLRWNHVFSPKLFSNFTLINSLYDYGMQLFYSAADIDFMSHLTSQSAKADFSWFANANNTVSFGLQGSYYVISPADLSPRSEGIFSEYKYPSTNAVEPAAYIQNEQKLTDAISLRYGLRLSYFSTIGAREQRYYNAEHTLDHTKEFGKWEKIKDWYALEPRFSSSFTLSPSMSLKAAYSRNVQYIQQAIFSISGSPMDIWFTASPTIKPQISDQFSAGVFKNFADDAVETSVELFYKNNKNTIDFKDHPNVIMNEDMEAELRSGKSYAYGAEVMVKYEKNAFNGWVGYTWSNAKYVIPEINDGTPYDSPTNHKHSVSVVGTYDITPRISVSADWIYYSGAPTTFPTGVYEINGTRIPLYSSRNSDHFPDYHRMDLSVTLHSGRVPKGERWHSEWNFSAYNLYARHNAWSLDFQYDPSGELNAKMYYLFKMIPSISYTLTF